MARVRIPVPLVVDIDRTLVSGDLLIEAAVRLIAASPLAVLSLPFRALLWIIDGGAALRRSLFRVGPLTSATLALNPAVMDEIAAAQASGRQVWLASTADEKMVAPLAQAVGAAGCIAADGRTRLTGGTRASALADRFGDGGFDYVGSARCDLPVWRLSRQAVGVGLSASVARAVRALDGEARLLPRVGARPFDYVRSLRPQQWIKNVLVFVPLLAAHETRLELWLAAAGLFGALSACASGTS